MDEETKPETPETNEPEAATEPEVRTYGSPAHRNWFRRHAKVLLITFGSLLLIFGVFWQRCGIRGCPDVSTLKGYMPDQASTIVDYRGQEFGKLFLTRHSIIPIDSMPEHIPNAFIAMEDKRFWNHNGVDWTRVFGAAYRNIKELGIAEGSSTITMQLARNVFPDQLPASKRNLFRKMAEARVAKAIEKEYEKKEILQLYLNQIYFGNGAYGIEAAAQEYYGKSAKKLTLAEAATMAALPRAPSRLNPRSNKELALQGRRAVLRRMVEQNLVTAEQAKEASDAKLRLRKGRQKGDVPAPYFIESVRALLEDELGDALYSQGYTIHTTLDARMQAVLEEELSKQLQAIEKGAFGSFRYASMAAARADTTSDQEGTSYLQTAAIFMEPRTGDIRALVGGRSFDDSEFNRALLAHRQPGSAFKPFVYAAAFAQGYSPTYRLVDKPLRLVMDRNTVWEPKNYDGGYAGVVSMRDALVYSKNIPTIRLATEIGISRVIDMARQGGLSGKIPAVPSVVLGTADVTPMEMTSAFSGFANVGQRALPRFVTKVVDREGKVVWSREPELVEAYDPGVAFMTLSLMQDVVDRGTGTAARAAGFRYPAAGKTGTTNDAADIWFIGMTPRVVGTIWIGFDQRQTVLRKGSGGELAAPVWGRVMGRSNQANQGWTAPGDVESRMVDSNGNAVGENCPIVGGVRKEYFLRGTEPIQTCYAPVEQYTWYDSAAVMDTTGYAVPPQAEDESDAKWWARMRARVFGKENEVVIDTSGYPTPAPAEPALGRPLPGTPPGTPPVTPPVNPSPNPNPATAPPPLEKPKPKPVPYDSLVKPAPDTTPAEPDSLAVRR